YLTFIALVTASAVRWQRFAVTGSRVAIRSSLIFIPLAAHGLGYMVLRTSVQVVLLLSAYSGPTTKPISFPVLQSGLLFIHQTQAKIISSHRPASCPWLNTTESITILILSETNPGLPSPH